MIFRTFIGVVLATPITLALFLLMQYLVTPERNLLEEVVETISIDITRAQREEDSDTNRELNRPDVEDQPPPPPPMDTRTERPDLSGISVELPEIDTSVGAGDIGPIDGDVQPLVRIEPDYPVRAQERGLEGFVRVGFTVTAEGTVTDVFVVETSNRLFDRAAIRAVSRWRYNPRIVNGEPVPRPGQRARFDFNLPDGQR